MKNLLSAVLPALALFALGGCAATSALTSSEDDGVYYSSKDRTTAVTRPTAPASAPGAPAREDANPDYRGTAPRSSARTGSDEYYDDSQSYTYMRGVPGYGGRAYGPGLGSYAPHSTYTTLSYGWGGGYSPYAYGFADPFCTTAFYSPFYSPFGYGPGISIGFGQPWGYGGGFYGYGRPYGHGFGGGFYDPYFYGSPFYGGYYGRGGYYGSNYYGGGGFGNGGYYGGNGGYYGGNGGYYGGNGGYYGGNGYTGGYDRNVRRTPSAHRSDRMSDGRYSADAADGSGTGGGGTGGGRGRTSERVANPDGGIKPQPAELASQRDRRRDEGATATPAELQPVRSDETYNKPRRLDGTDRPRYRTPESVSATETPTDAGQGPDQLNRNEGKGRLRNTDATLGGAQDQAQPTAMPQPQDQPRRRERFYSEAPAQLGNGGEQTTEQPARRRSYEQPQQPTYEQPRQRTYEQPRQRTYEQPQQRSYEQPQQRSESQPSYSAPSGGGSNSGGGGGGGGRGRGRD